MYPDQFGYHRAASVEDALDVIASHPGARLLAGGHSLLPNLKSGAASPDALVDVSHLDELAGVEAGDPSTVGALTTHASVADDDGLWSCAPVLAEAATKLGDRQVRNRGTVGGNLTAANPAADLPAAVVAADATLVLHDPDGEREVGADEFFAGDGDTVLGDAELLTEIRVPAAAGGAYVRKTHPTTGFALVGVAAVLAVSNGDVTNARVAATGATDRPERLSAVEDALVGGAATDECAAAAAERAGDSLDPARFRSDVAVSGEYRAHLLGPYAERAVTAALDRAAGVEVSADE